MRSVAVAFLAAAVVACARTELPIAETDGGGVICALHLGQITPSEEAEAGPFEFCTPEYPTCIDPDPESPGYQCCYIQHLAGGGGEGMCMASH